jgi:3-dehydroquinate synthase
MGVKNLVGTFCLADAYVVDHRFLKTLPKSQIIDGLGEIIKYGLIKDPSILSVLQKEKLSSLQNGRTLATLVDKSILVKNYHTRHDWKEKKARIMLNFGHTYGHGIELKYGMSHGYAVIIGMLAELKLGEKLGITPTSVRKNILTLLYKLGIDTSGVFKFDPRLLQHDKKIKGKVIILPVIVKEGHAKLVAISTRRLKELFSTI